MLGLAHTFSEPCCSLRLFLSKPPSSLSPFWSVRPTPKSEGSQCLSLLLLPLSFYRCSPQQTSCALNPIWWASLVVQWIRICLPMQGTWVWSLVQEDPSCRGATKPVRHNYWACALEPASHNCWSPCAWSPCSTTREATAMRSPRTATKSSPRSLQLEKAHMQQWRPNTAKNK